MAVGAFRCSPSARPPTRIGGHWCEWRHTVRLGVSAPEETCRSTRVSAVRLTAILRLHCDARTSPMRFQGFGSVAASQGNYA